MTKRWLAAGALLVAATAAVPAAARSDDEEPNVTPQDPNPRAGLDLGVRTGYAVPFGPKDTVASQVGEQIYGAVPLVLEIAVSANPHLSIGVMFQYGFAQLKDMRSNGCGTNGLSCSASTTHLALEAILHPKAQGEFLPWVGLGTGYEWFSEDASMAGISVSAGADGFEFAILQAGADIRVSSQFVIGPFVMFSLGRYGTGTLDHMPAEIVSTRPHEWLTFGLRGNLSL